ncbi:19056_t:CDS:1, partial [Gigaspora rosea]
LEKKLIDLEESVSHKYSLVLAGLISTVHDMKYEEFLRKFKYLNR